MSFNNRFHWEYTRLQAPYVVDDATTLEVYYEGLDSLATTFLKWRHNPPTTLVHTQSFSRLEQIEDNTYLALYHH